MMLIAFSVCPIFLLQKSISYTAFYRTAYVIVPWFVCCTVLWGFMNKDHAQIEFQITFWAFSGLPAIIIGMLLLRLLRIYLFILVVSCFMWGGALDNPYFRHHYHTLSHQ